MFGIGMQEIVLICAIALIVVGPKKLPEIARALGKGYGEFRRAFEEMKRNVETDFQTEEIRRSLLDLPPPPAASRPKSETLLTDQPAPPPNEELFAYPETLDDSPPPPPPPPDPAPGPAPASTDGETHG